MFIPLPLKRPEAQKPLTFRLEPKHDLTKFAAGTDDIYSHAMKGIVYNPARGEVVATDSCVLAMSQVGEPQDGEAVMMDAEFVQAVTEKGATCTVKDRVVSAFVNGKQVESKPVGGRFPRYANAIPTEEPAVTITLDARYIRKVCKHVIAEWRRNGSHTSPTIDVSVSSDPGKAVFIADSLGNSFVVMPLEGGTE